VVGYPAEKLNPFFMPDLPYYIIGLSVSIILLAGIVVFWRRKRKKGE